MRLFNITLVLVLFYFGYFLTVEISHGTDQITCGPFPNLTSADSLIISDIKSTAVLKQLWENVINYSPFFWILLLLCVTNIFFLNNHLTVLKDYLKDKKLDYEDQIEELQRINARLNKQKKLNENVVKIN